jgi:hypothetical protein
MKKWILAVFLCLATSKFSIANVLTGTECGGRLGTKCRLCLESLVAPRTSSGQLASVCSEPYEQTDEAISRIRDLRYMIETDQLRINQLPAENFNVNSLWNSNRATTCRNVAATADRFNEIRQSRCATETSPRTAPATGRQ